MCTQTLLLTTSCQCSQFTNYLRRRQCVFQLCIAAKETALKLSAFNLIYTISQLLHVVRAQPGQFSFAVSHAVATRGQLGLESCAGLTELDIQDAPPHAWQPLLATRGRSARAANDSFCRWPLQVGSERECPKGECSRRSMQKLKAFLRVNFRNPNHFCYILLVQKVTKASPHSSRGKLNTIS